MDVTIMISSVYKVAKETKELVETVKANRKQCFYLSERVQTVTSAIPRYQEFNKLSPDEQKKLQHPLDRLLKVLRACKRQIAKFTKKNNWLSEAWNVYSVQEKFDKLNKRLTDAAGDTQLGAVVGHALRQAHDTLLNAQRREEDRQARAQDSEEFRAILQQLTTLATATNQQAQQLSQDSAERHTMVINTIREAVNSIRDKVYGIDKHFIISKSSLQYDSDEKLNYGALGWVYSGTWYGLPVVVREVYLGNTKHQHLFSRETELMWRMNAPHMLKFYGACVDLQSQQGLQVFEKIEDVQLLTSLRGQCSDEKVKTQLAIQLIQALCLLRDKKTKYTDFGLDNILLDKDYRVKLSGLAYMKMDTLSIVPTSKSNPVFLCKPLEAIRERKYHSRSDVYSLGVVLWCLWAEELPYEARITDKTIQDWEVEEKLKNYLIQENAGLGEFNESIQQTNYPRFLLHLQN